jgi:hypothetical protein
VSTPSLGEATADRVAVGVGVALGPADGPPLVSEGTGTTRTVFPPPDSAPTTTRLLSSGDRIACSGSESTMTSVRGVASSSGAHSAPLSGQTSEYDSV